MFSRPMRSFSKRGWHRFMVCAAADGYCVVHYPTQGSWLDFDYYADFFCIPHRPKACPKGWRRGGIWFHAPHFFTY